MDRHFLRTCYRAYKEVHQSLFTAMNARVFTVLIAKRSHMFFFPPPFSFLQAIKNRQNTQKQVIERQISDQLHKFLIMFQRIAVTIYNCTKKNAYGTPFPLSGTFKGPNNRIFHYFSYNFTSCWIYHYCTSYSMYLNRTLQTAEEKCVQTRICAKRIRREQLNPN